MGPENTELWVDEEKITVRLNSGELNTNICHLSKTENISENVVTFNKLHIHQS